MDKKKHTKVKAKIPKKRGRLSKRRLLNVDIAYNLAEKGNHIAEIAEIIGVSTQSIYNWMHKDEKLFDAIKRGRKIADARVEDSLYKRAMGYEYDEVKNKVIIVNGKPSNMAERTIIKKEVLADVTAQIFWLKNRQPETWRDRVDPSTLVDKSKHYHYTQISDEKLIEKIRAAGISLPAAIKGRIGTENKA